jgi:hypothetical protein
MGIAMYQLCGNYAFNQCTVTSEGVDFLKVELSKDIQIEKR